MPNTVPDNSVHVAVAAIVNDSGQVLISQRPAHVHQGGLWEFPGGKVEAGETVQQALRREIAEELDLLIEHAQPLIRIPYSYPDRRVLLDVWKATAFSGEPRGCEGQTIEWLALEQLGERAFPAANRSIITALQLPREYLVTPEPDGDPDTFLRRLEASLDSGLRLVQLRARRLASPDYHELASRVVRLCHARQARVLLNADAAIVQKLGADGVHLSSERLRACRARPLPAHMLVAASCHDERELQAAAETGADFALLSPVLATASHPDTAPLGWESFAAQVEACSLPVYALGGMQRSLSGTAIAHGAQGIAAIRSLWVDA